MIHGLVRHPKEAAKLIAVGDSADDRLYGWLQLGPVNKDAVPVSVIRKVTNEYNGNVLNRVVVVTTTGRYVLVRPSSMSEIAVQPFEQ